MVKIKQKKQLNLPQLIEWAMENIDIARNKTFKVKGEERHSGVYLNYNEDGIRLNGDIKFTDTFTVEVVEEITEDTHLDYLYALTNDEEKEIHRCMNFTIRNASMVIGRNDLTFFTLIDNDLVKIYENGKLVE